MVWEAVEESPTQRKTANPIHPSSFPRKWESRRINGLLDARLHGHDISGMFRVRKQTLSTPCWKNGNPAYHCGRDEEQSGPSDIGSATNRHKLIMCDLYVQIKWAAVDEDVHRAQDEEGWKSGFLIGAGAT